MEPRLYLVRKKILIGNRQNILETKLNTGNIYITTGLKVDAHEFVYAKTNTAP